MSAERPWYVYVLRSQLGRSYVGITAALLERLDAHNGLRAGGAKATRGGRPWRLRVAYGPFPSRGDAQRVEHAVKQRRGAAREQAALPVALRVRP